MNALAPLCRVIATALLFFLPGHSPGATFNISNGNITALKNAINSANANGESDVIALARGGTYTLSAADNNTAGGNGLPVMVNDLFYTGRDPDLVIRGNGATIRRSSANGTPRFRILQIAEGASVTIDSLTISNGNLVNSIGGFGAVGGGGGVYCSQSALTLTGCTFSANSAQGPSGANGVEFGSHNGSPGGAGLGGGLYASGGSLSLSNCSFSTNTAKGGSGGAAWTFLASGAGGNGGHGRGGGLGVTNGALTLVNCSFTANVSVGGDGGPGTVNGYAGGGYGGGLSPGIGTIVTNCNFSGNSADAGGAISDDPFGIVAGTLAINESNFTGNTSGNGGGGISYGSYNGSLIMSRCTFTSNATTYVGGGGLLNNGPATVSECIFDDNSAPNGGGIHHRSGTLTLTNSTFSNNRATEVGSYEFYGGGGVYNGYALSVTNCTFYQNASASKGGAIFNGRASISGDNVTLALHNSTLNANTAPGNGGGLYFAADGAPASGNLVNNIFKSDAATATIRSGGTGTISSQGNNLSSDNGGGFLIAAGDRINTDPQLGAFGPNGGFTQTHALLSGSPAIDAGSDADAPSRDQRGYLRNGRSDIGAFESAANLLRLVGMARSGNDITVSCQVVAGGRYRLERNLGLTDTSWQNLAPGVPELIATGNDTAVITDPNGATLGRAFYRVTVVP